MTELLRVDDLRVQYDRRGAHGEAKHIQAVDGVSFEVQRGETLGLVGESGCGKSTLARSIVGLHCAAGGAVWLNGIETTRLSRRQWRRSRSIVQLVFQDSASALNPRMSVHDLVAEPLRINGGYSADRVVSLLEQVQLDADFAHRRPGELSGGQRQRVSIARALALEPQLLILDEPVSALDASVRAQVINLLRDLQRELGMAYLLIAHDLSMIEQICHRVGVMYLGKIVELGSSQDVFTTPQHPYTRALLSSIPDPDPFTRGERARIVLGGDPPDPAAVRQGCPFHSRCPEARQECRTLRPVLTPQAELGHQAACLFAGVPAGIEGEKQPVPDVKVGGDRLDCNRRATKSASTTKGPR